MMNFSIKLKKKCSQTLRLIPTMSLLCLKILVGDNHPPGMNASPKTRRKTLKVKDVAMFLLTTKENSLIAKPHTV